MRFRLREYMHESVHLAYADRDRALLSRLSQQMHYEVSWFINRTWLETVWYLKDSDDSKRDILVKLASVLRAAIFYQASGAARVYILLAEVSLYNCKVRRTGMVWGEDILSTRQGLGMVPCPCDDLFMAIVSMRQLYVV